MKTRRLLGAGAAVAEIERPQEPWWRRARSGFFLSQAAQGERLTRSNFRRGRMVYRFAVISPALYLLSALVFSVCLLLAAFSL